MSERTLTKDEWRVQCVKMAEKPPMKPGRGRVLVSREPSSNVLAQVQTNDGKMVELHGADTYKEPAQRGLVIALGAPKLTMMGGPIPFWVTPGQIVTFPQHAGKQYVAGSHEFVVLEEDEILAAIPKE